jgi:hypothetical protein
LCSNRHAARILGAKPRILGAKPRILGAKPRILGAKPRILGAKTRILGAKTRILGAKLTLTRSPLVPPRSARRYFKKTANPQRNIKRVCTLTNHSTRKRSNFRRRYKHVEH